MTDLTDSATGGASIGAEGGAVVVGVPAAQEAESDARRRRARGGLMYVVGAYVAWGFAANYFKLLTHVPAPVVLCHRVVWSVVVIGALLSWRGQWADVRAAVRDVRVLGWLCVTSVLIAVNWLVFIYAIGVGRLIESSLGYFINPLFTVMLGVVFLKEKLRPAQLVALIIAAAALGYLVVARGGVPWIALVLPGVFGVYSLIRKRLAVGPLAGLFVETAILLPPAAGYLLWAHAGQGVEYHTAGTWALLALTGVVTAVPMLWFIEATKRLTLVTIGFAQFINPTLQFLTAVVIFGEPFTRERVIAFSLIWVAVGVFVVDLARGRFANGK